MDKISHRGFVRSRTYRETREVLGWDLERLLALWDGGRRERGGH